MRFKYKSYSGEEDHFFILCADADKNKVAEVANVIAEEGFRVSYEVIDFKEKNEVTLIAEKMEKGAAVLMFLSEKACSKLFFRDCINMAVEKKALNVDGEMRQEERKALFVYLDGFVPTEGLAIQLAKKPTLAYTDVTGLLDRLTGEELLTQAMKGGKESAGMPSVRKIILTLVFLALAGTLAFGVYWAAENRQNDLRLSGLNGAENVDITKRGIETLNELRGMTIGTLYMQDCGIDDVTAVGEIDLSVVDLSHNPKITSLAPLLQCEHLKKVIVSTDMVDLTGIFDGTGVIVEIVP